MVFCTGIGPENIGFSSTYADSRFVHRRSRHETPFSTDHGGGNSVEKGANLVFAVIDEMLPREKPCYFTTAGPYNGSYIRTGDGGRGHAGVCLCSPTASKSPTPAVCSAR